LHLENESVVLARTWESLEALPHVCNLRSASPCSTNAARSVGHTMSLERLFLVNSLLEIITDAEQSPQLLAKGATL
jgi:hypothetical protein